MTHLARFVSVHNFFALHGVKPIVLGGHDLGADLVAVDFGHLDVSKDQIERVSAAGQQQSFLEALDCFGARQKLKSGYLEVFQHSFESHEIEIVVIANKHFHLA